MPGPADAGTVTWLVLVYHLPPGSSGLRSLVRRKLTAAGAVYLSRACAAVPAGPAERVMRRMRATIVGAGGSAVLLRARELCGHEVAAAFNRARDREYDDIIARCGDAVAAIETLIAAGELRWEQLSDNDARLKQLDTRYLTAGEYDLLGARKAQQVASDLARYRSVLDEYARRLDAADNSP